MHLHYSLHGIHTLLMRLVNRMQGMLQKTSREYNSTVLEELTKASDATNYKTD